MLHSLCTLFSTNRRSVLFVIAQRRLFLHFLFMPFFPIVVYRPITSLFKPFPEKQCRYLPVRHSRSLKEKSHSFIPLNFGNVVVLRFLTPNRSAANSQLHLAYTGLFLYQVFTPVQAFPGTVSPGYMFCIIYFIKYVIKLPITQRLKKLFVMTIPKQRPAIEHILWKMTS